MDGLLQKLTVAVDAGTTEATMASIHAILGEDAVDNWVTRDPTLEEAYLSILS